MRRLSAIAVMAVVVVLGAASARASTIFKATLTNNQENPPVNPTLVGGGARPASFGSATFELNDAMTAMSFTATIFNIDVNGSQSVDTNDNLTAAHIHAGINLPPLNNGVVWGFFGAPFNDNNPNDLVVIPFASGVGFTISGKWDALEGNAGTNLAAQLPNIFAGRAYMNFHTSQFPGGEVRGQIVVPEPSALLLLGAGLAGALRLRRSRRA